MTTTHTVDVQGAIDADGHILEPPDLWEKYLEPRYRERAIRLRVGADGLEYFEFDGKPSKLIRPGFAGIMGGMDAEHIRPSPERTYLRGAPFGSMHAKERIVRLDQDGIDKAILYPTVSYMEEVARLVALLNEKAGRGFPASLALGPENILIHKGMPKRALA